jgi:hypothetical protein
MTTSTNNYLTVVFRADASIALEGFSASYTTLNATLGTCRGRSRSRNPLCFKNDNALAQSTPVCGREKSVVNGPNGISIS